MTLRVRRAVHGDESLLRELRLRALRGAPEAFGSTLERELARTPADWRRWFDGGTVFLLEAEGAPRGLAATVPHDSDPHSAFVMSMWIDPEWRGRGGADRLLAALADAARAAGTTRLYLHVIEGNAPAWRCYERFGFRETGESFVRERDGLCEVEMRLDLEPPD